MEPDAADINPTGRQPNKRKKETEFAPFDAHCEIDSIVLNAPVADVYAYCSRFGRVAQIHAVSTRYSESRRNPFLVHFSDRWRRTTDRSADRASCSGAANCVASNLGQFSARRHFIGAALRSNDGDYGEVAIEHRTGNARQSHARLSHEFQTGRGGGMTPSISARRALGS